jgi:hypothetical protein
MMSKYTGIIALVAIVNGLCLFGLRYRLAQLELDYKHHQYETRE